VAASVCGLPGTHWKIWAAVYVVPSTRKLFPAGAVLTVTVVRMVNVPVAEPL
jgi:hypothetical protein